MMKKSAVVLTLVVFLLVFAFAGCNAAEGQEVDASADTVAEQEVVSETAEPVEIGFIVGNQTMDFFLNMQQGVMDAVAEGDKISTYSFDDDPTKQSGIFEDLIVKDVDVIITSILDAESVYASLVKAQEAGIPVILLDGYPTAEDQQDLYVCTVVNDLYGAGYQHGKMLCEAIGGQGEIGYIWIAGLPDVSNQRIYGFQDAVAEYPDVEIVAYTEINGVDTETCLNAISAQLQVHPEIDAYFTPWANAGLAAVTALAAAGMEDVELAIIDMDATLGQYIVDGKVLTCMDLNSYGMGQKAMELAYQYLAGEEITDKVYKIQTIPVTADNVADYLE